jgi:hypothetical protein
MVSPDRAHLSNENAVGACPAGRFEPDRFELAGFDHQCNADGAEDFFGWAMVAMRRKLSDGNHMEGRDIVVRGAPLRPLLLLAFPYYQA